MSPHHWPRFLVTYWVFTLCIVRNKSASCSTAQSWVFLAPEWTVQVLTWSPRTSQMNFLQPQDDSGSSACAGICAPTQVAKRLIPQNLLWGILFLRLEGTHLRSQGGVFDGGHYTMLHVNTKAMCVWSWLVSNPANMEITRFSGGVITPYQECFFYFF